MFKTQNKKTPSSKATTQSSVPISLQTTTVANKISSVRQWWKWCRAALSATQADSVI